MKKLALALMAASAAVFGFGMVAQAQTGYSPSVALTPAAPTAGGGYTAVYRNCTAGDTITFTQAQSTPTSGTAPCIAISVPALTGSVVGLLRPQQAPLGNATFAFAAAPTAPGTYNGTAVGEDSPSQAFGFTIPGQATTTAVATTAPPTTPPPTANAASPTTATPPALTVPGSGLPATGSDGIGTTTGIALGLLVVGLGLFVVAQVRRRQSPSAA